MAVPGLIAAGEFVAGNPFLSALAAKIGGDLLGRFTGTESPFAGAVQDQLQAGQRLLPQLESQARGEPSVASQNIGRQLRQQTTSRQQSFAAGATARGGGGTPVAAQLDRFRGDEQQALGNVLAQLQQGSQNAILGLGQTGLEQQNLLEIEQARNTQQFATALSDFFGRREERKTLEPLLQKLGDRIEQAVLGSLDLTQGGSDFAGQFNDPTAGGLFR